MIKLKNKNIIPLIVAAIILCLNPIWPLWGGRGVSIGYILVLILALLRYRSLTLIFSNIFIFFLFALICLCFILHPLFVGFHTVNLLVILSFFVALSLSQLECRKTLDFLTNALAWIIGISLPVWLLHVFVVDIPSIGQIDNSDFKGMGYIMDNHLLFVTLSGSNAFRFYSMFDEPGVLGTLSAFILFANKYNFRDLKNVIILLGAIFSFSLAFYMISFLGYMFYAIKSFRKFCSSVIFLILLTFITYNLLKENLAFQYSIINRFQTSNVENMESRTGYKASLFYKKFWATSDAVLGIGDDRMRNEGLKEGQSYKLFVIEYGWLSIVCLLFMYMTLAGKFNGAVIMLFILYCLSFLQRPFAFTIWQILLFYCIASVSKYDIFKRNKI